MQNGDMSELSSSQFPEVYAKLGIDTSDLGCIMLNLSTIPVTDMVVDSDESLYFSQFQEFVQGSPAEVKPHITVLYGLLQHGSEIKDLVNAVLDDWDYPTHVNVESIGVFPGTEEDGTEYSCIVAHIAVTDELLEGNKRLRLLPHIDTFPDYKPHMTLAYVKAEATSEWVESLQTLVGQGIQVHGINYGK